MFHLPGKQKKEQKEESPRGKDGEEQQQQNLFSALSKPLNDVAKPFHVAADAMKAAGSGISGKRKEKSNTQEDTPSEKSAFGALQAAISPVSAGSKALMEGVRNISSQTKKKEGTGNQKETATAADDDSGGPEGDATLTMAMEPDKQLESMNVIIKKCLKGVSVKNWYETCWSEGVQTDKEPFYGPWLSESGKNDVCVEDWTFASENEPIIGDWDKENYHQTRKVTFSMERSSGLYSGSTTTNVTHTQFARLEDNRCVVSTTVRMTGIPFADAFYVVIRWVGSSQGRDLLVEVGLFVVFVKQVIVSGQIRSGTTQQTTQTQLDLFRRMKATLCVSDENAPVSEDGKDEEVVAVSRDSTGSQPPLDLLSQKLHKMFSLCFPFWMKPEEDEDSDDIDRVMKAIHVNLRVIRGLPSTGNESEAEADNLKYVIGEFESAQDALDKCLMKFISKSKSEKDKSAIEDDDAAVTTTSTSSSAEKFFGSMMRPLQRVVSLGDSGSKKSSPLRERLLGSPKKSKGEDPCLTTDGPDKVLEGMNVIIDKEIPNTSIKKIYDSCISETKPFCQSWLEGMGATEVIIEDWVIANDGDKGFSDGWSEETYSQKRKVTYSILRKSVVGNEVETEVTQNHYCRFYGDKRLILQVTMDTSGKPFGDNHTDMIRHVYTQSEDDVVSVKVGVFIMLRKGTKTVLLSQKVRVEASKEATKHQMELFRSIRASVGAGTSDATVEQYVDVQREIDKMEPFRCVKLPLQTCLSRTQRLSHMYPGGLLEDNDAVKDQLNLVDTKIRAIEPFIDGRIRGEDNEVLHYVLSELELVDESLNNIIIWHGDQLKGKEALNRASFE